MKHILTKMSLTVAVVLLVLLSYRGAGPVQAAEAVYVESGGYDCFLFICFYEPSDLYLVDPTAGGGEALIGTIRTGDGTTPPISDIALSPSGQLYGASFDTLYTIDRETAVATQVGTGLGLDDLNALTFSSSGTLYGATIGGSLVTIDVDTGAASVVGALGPGLGSSGDLTFSFGGVLYATLRQEGVANDVLAVIDPSSGAATKVGTSDLGFANVLGLTFVDGQLTGFASGDPSCGTGSVIQVDPIAGTGSFVRCLPFDAWGADSLNQPPTTPSNPSQFKSDGVTEIPVGATTLESTVVFKAILNDSDSDRVKLQIELRHLDEFGGSFTGEPTQGSDFVSSGSQATIAVFGLVPGDYHWRARAMDERGAVSEWVSFGGNPDSAVDFRVLKIPWPSSGFLGWIFHSRTTPAEGGARACSIDPKEKPHLGVDIWSADGDLQNGGVSEGNPVYLPYEGKLLWRRKDRLVFQHDSILPGGEPLYSLYFHMADHVTGESYVNPSLQEGSTYPAGTPLGNQGNKLAGASYRETVAVHLHFSLSPEPREHLGLSLDPSDFLGLQLDTCKPSPVPWMYAVSAPDTGRARPTMTKVEPLQANAGEEFFLTVTGDNLDIAPSVANPCADGARVQIFLPPTSRVPNGQFVGEGSIVSRTSTQLVVRATINDPGTYKLLVRNSDCQQSPQRLEIVIR